MSGSTEVPSIDSTIDGSSARPASGIRFSFEGRLLEARAGDTVAAALLRAGIRTFSRGPKYHRPRGPFCLQGSCGQCQMRCGGEANVPTCEAPVRPGLAVERQNAVGSADFDLMRVVDWLIPGSLDHHHLVTRPRLANELMHRVARRLAGIGTVPDAPPSSGVGQRLETSVCIVGMGRAGRAAAEAVQQSGLSWRGISPHARDVAVSNDSDPSSSGLLPASRALAVFRSHEAAEGRWDVLIQQVSGDGTARLSWIRCDALIVATGGTERPGSFAHADRPGVFSGRGLVRLWREHGVVPARRLAVVGEGPDRAAVAATLADAGVSIVGQWSIIDAVEGSDAVEAVRVGNDRFPCDGVAVVEPLQPAYELAAEAGAQAVLDVEQGGFVVRADSEGATGVDGLWVAGAVAGRAASAEQARDSGTRAALALARCLPSPG